MLHSYDKEGTLKRSPTIVNIKIYRVQANQKTKASIRIMAKNTISAPRTNPKTKSQRNIRLEVWNFHHSYV